ncbi:hypothetical protein ATANTOWER_001939, partial [Ataeniobius toweri]|nr:hypothetical protein [Ataeniobius toweri]
CKASFRSSIEPLSLPACQIRTSLDMHQDCFCCRCTSTSCGVEQLQQTCSCPTSAW